MKFCSSCGKEISETAAFCDGCGAKTSGDTAVDVMEKKDSVVSKTVANKELSEIQEREQVLGQMYVCYDAILAIGVAHEELSKAEELLKKEYLLETLKKKIVKDGENHILTTDENLLKTQADFDKKIFPILGKALGICFGAILFLLLMFGVILKYILILTPILTIVLFVAYICSSWETIVNEEEKAKEAAVNLIKLKEKKEEVANAKTALLNIKKSIEAINENIPPLQQTLQSICEEESSRFMMEYLPKDYCNLDAISSFITYLENKRADTFKEAINVYEDEKHKSKMEKMQQVNMDKLNTQSKMMAKSMEQQALWQKENVARQERMIANSEKINEEIRFGNAVSVINLVDRWEQEGRNNMKK